MGLDFYFTSYSYSPLKLQLKWWNEPSPSELMLQGQLGFGEAVLLSATIYKILHIYGLNLKPKGITRSAHYKRIKENLVMFARKDETQIRFYLPNESKIYLKIYSSWKLCLIKQKKKKMHQNAWKNYLWDMKLCF